MKNNKGITLASLVLTIIVLLILASIFVYSGVNTVRYTKFNKAKSEISVVQTNVNSWYQELKNIENTDEYKALQTDDEKLQYKNNFLNDKGYGVTTDDPACSQKKLDDTLQGLNDKGIEIENFDNYRFLSSKFLENKLGLNASYDFLANIEDRTVILFGGLEYNGEWYYTMEDFGLTNIKSTTPNSVSFELKQEDIASTDILIYNLVFTDANGNPFEVSKFNTYISETGKNEWMEVSSKVSKTTYNNATAFRISNNLERKSYDVKIETVDKNLKSELVTVAIEEPRAIFKTGAEVNAKMKQLAGTKNATYQTQDTNITEIKRATEISAANKIDSNIVSTSESNTPIYMWFDNGIINWYTEDYEPSLNTDSSQMFRSLCVLTNLDLNYFNTSNVTNMKTMFYNSKVITSLDLSKFDTLKVTNMESMFENCNGLRDLNISGINTSNVTTMKWMFYQCNSIINLNLRNFETSKVIYMRQMFARCNSLVNLDININKFNTSNVTDMYAMFNGCNALTGLDLSGFNTSKVTNMSRMFYDCSSLTSLDLSSFNTSNVTDMSRMFQECKSLTSINVSSFVTSNVTDMQSMFREISNLTSLNLSSFDTSKVTDMQFMFYKCSSLKSLDLSSFETSKVTDMQSMFEECASANSINVSSFITENVTNIKWMFYKCNSLTSLDLSIFDTSKVTDMLGMFGDCGNLTTIFASNKFVTSKFEQGVYVDPDGNETFSTNMFLYCTKLKGGSGTTYSEANVDKTYAHIDGGTSNPGYFTAK